MTNAWPTRTGTERNDYADLECSPAGGHGLVYFLGSPDGARIKVGWSSRIEKWSRIADHKSGDAFGRGEELTVLAVVRATSREGEQLVLRHFAEHLIEGSRKQEVFHAEPLLEYVVWLRDLYFVSTTEAEFHSETGRKVMDLTAWVPGPGRVSSRRATHHPLFAEADPWWARLPSRDVTGDDYYTPAAYLDAIRVALGGVIDLDPASHVIANVTVGAREFFTVDQNGLVQPWHGRVFLNPPFSGWPVWVPKVLGEVALGNVDAFVCLGATRTLTAHYFAPLLERADAFTIIKGRRPFQGISTESTSPTDGHFLIYIGPDPAVFARAMSGLGAVFYPARETVK